MSGTVYPVFGSSTPFAEPNWYQGYATPFYRPSHLAYRAKVRSFVDTELVPFVHAWDESGVYPRELHQKAYLAGVYGSSWPHKYGGKGPEDADQFHRLILDDGKRREKKKGDTFFCSVSFRFVLFCFVLFCFVLFVLVIVLVLVLVLGFILF